MALQNRFEVLRMFLALALDAKIVNDQSELDGAPFVFLQPRNVLALVVAVLVESFLKQFVGY